MFTSLFYIIINHLFSILAVFSKRLNLFMRNLKLNRNKHQAIQMQLQHIVINSQIRHQKVQISIFLLIVNGIQALIHHSKDLLIIGIQTA